MINNLNVMQSPRQPSPAPWTDIIERFAYALLSPLLLCSRKKPASGSLHTKSSVDCLSDNEIADLAKSSPKIDANTFYVEEFGGMNPGTIAKISPDAVTKPVDWKNGEAELLSANLVWRSTCIPVPFCHRLVKSAHDEWLVQEFIPGRTVASAWPGLTWWRRFRIALTLRYYIYQLRSVPMSESKPAFPGPPAVDGEPQLCTGRLFTNYGSGPFSTYRALSRWYKNRLLVIQKYRNEGLGAKQFDDGAPLVFTHLDLHPLNLILGDDGQLWVVDWTHAGWYPPWFEAASMQLFFTLKGSTIDDLKGWNAWISFIAGNCERPGQLPFIRAIGYSLGVLHSNIMNLIDNSPEFQD